MKWVSKKFVARQGIEISNQGKAVIVAETKPKSA